MSISDLQVTANRENAKRSTGPRTAQGKSRSSLNAIRHGLTAQVVVLPEDDMNAYKLFCRGYFTEWDPKTPTETQLVQTLIDTQWRLNRARSHEHSLLALGHFGQAGNIDTGDPQIHATFTAARMLLEHSRDFDNLSKHEQRLTRILHSTMTLLRDMQAQRKERERAELPAAAKNYKLHKMKSISYDPAEDGFVLTIPQIDNWIARQERSEEAEIAEEVQYDVEEFRRLIVAA